MVEWKRKLEILSWSSVVQTLEIFALNSHDNHDPHSDISELNHCVKSGQIRSFFWSVFSRIRTEYGETVSLRIHSECGKTRTRKNAVFGHFSRSKYFIIVGFLLTFYVFPLISNMFFSIVVSFDFVKKVSRAETFNLTFFKSRMGL